jgi:hypothetical protein
MLKTFNNLRLRENASGASKLKEIIGEQLCHGLG